VSGNTVISADGTRIAYDTVGSGEPVILVGGVFSYRAWPQPRQLAQLLSGRFTVVNYDRRGRGDSGDTKPYAVEREIEDIDALIEAVGGSAHVCGWSSGGVLALKAAVAGSAVERLAVYEPPFVVPGSAHVPPEDFVSQLNRLVEAGRRSDAAKYYFAEVMGMPRLMVRAVPLMRRPWKRIKTVAHTAAYEAAVVEDNLRGRPLRAEQWAPAKLPTLVVNGEKSDALLHHAARALLDVLPNGRHVVLAGQGHNVSMKALAPVLDEFFAG
jgi:pimeloyl-ACP methyl ester carboxylesterase